MIGGAISVPLLSVKSEPRAFFPDGAPFSSALELFEEEFYFFSPLRVLVSVDGDDPLHALRQSGQLRDVLAEHQGVRQVSMQAAINDQGAYVLTALLTSEDALVSVRELIDAAALSDDVTTAYSSASLVYSDIDRQAMDSLIALAGLVGCADLRCHSACLSLLASTVQRNVGKRRSVAACLWRRVANRESAKPCNGVRFSRGAGRHCRRLDSYSVLAGERETLCPAAASSSAYC